MNLTEFSKRYHRYRIVPLLLGIFLLGFSIRYLARGPRIGPELDTWFHFRIVNYILDLGYVPKIDLLAYYPTGRLVWETDLLGLPFFIAYTYKIVGLTGITVMDYMVAFPAILTSLAAIPLYFLAKEVLGHRTGLLAALFWQIIPSTLTRTHAGFVDKESLASVYIFIWLWLFLVSIRTADPANRRTLLPPILAGVFMGLSAWTWGGTDYFILVITSSIFIYTLLNFRKLTESFEISFILMTFFGALTSMVVQAPRFPLSRYYVSFIYMGLLLLSSLFALLLLHSYLNIKMGEKNSRNIVATAVLLFLAVGGLSGRLQGFLRSIYIFTTQRVFLTKGLIGQTVSENLSPSLFCGGGSIITQIRNCDWYSHFDVVLFVAPIGLLLLLNRHRKMRDYPSLFVIILALSGVMGMRSDVRLGYVLTPSLAILTAYSVFYFVDDLLKKEAELNHSLAHSKKQKVRYKAETKLSNLRMTKLLLLVILFGVVASPAVRSFSMLNGRTVDVPTPWYNAMVWINDNTPQNAVIVSWWDYGYWEQGIGKRMTVVDGGNAGPLVYNTEFTEGLDYRGSEVHRDVDMAKMFTSPEDEALTYLRPYVDYENVPTYVLVSFEEFGKSGAINTISQGGGLYISPRNFPRTNDDERDFAEINDFLINNGIEAFQIVNMGSSWQVWYTGFVPVIDDKGVLIGFNPNPEMKNKLLPKLLPFQNTGFGQGLKHFELVYQDQWNYVLIYKIV